MIALAVFVGAWIQAVVGLGVGLVAAPVVAILEPSLMPSLPLWIGLFTSGLSLAGERSHVDWHAVRWTLSGRVLGLLPGVWLLVVLSPREVGITVAAVVLLAVVLSWRPLDVPVNRGTMVGAGLLGGVGGAVTSIAGPPVALLFQHRRPSEVRSTLAVYFFVGVVLTLTALAVAGRLPWGSLILAVLVSPFLLGGILLGARTRDRIPRERFRVAVLVVCAASAVVLLARSLT